ncbi:MAG: tetratricopeptide repeat protein [Parvibaculaceae bacterium]
MRTYSILLAAAVTGLVSQPPAVSAQEADADTFGSQFYSFMPAKPKIDPPSLLGDISLWQNHMQKAKKAYRNGDYDKARKHLEAAVENGNVVANWYLGHIWRLGLGVQVDQAKAFDCYRKVAEDYDPSEPRPGVLDIMVDSIVRVADYYRDGDAAAGIRADPQRAFQLYNAAVGYAHPGAQFGLGSMYLKGSWVNRNTNQALRWLTLAARKRYAPAQALLGDLYWGGEIVRQDRSAAVMWYTLATQASRPEQQPQIFDRLDIMLAQVSPTERADGEAGAQAWSERFPPAPVTLSSEVQ